MANDRCNQIRIHHNQLGSQRVSARERVVSGEASLIRRTLSELFNVLNLIEAQARDHAIPLCQHLHY